MKRAVFLAVAAAVGLAAAGCVERQIVIRTEPTDALVSLDHREIGRSPATAPFTFYGTRRITIQKDGYETIETLETVRPPWYQVFPLDFFSEVLLPVNLVDRHEFTYILKPPAPLSEEALLDRADAFRTQVKQP